MKYGIKQGQVWQRADGTPWCVTVLDTTTHAHCEDVVIFDHFKGHARRIDAFKLTVRHRVLWQQ